jgi:hypothetical protein
MPQFLNQIYTTSLTLPFEEENEYRLKAGFLGEL